MLTVTVTHTAGISSRAGNASLRDTEGYRSNDVTAYRLPLKKKKGSHKAQAKPKFAM